MPLQYDGGPAMPVDLRSDTVTRPTAAMRAAMADAEVGDDVYGEDPTVNRLEQRAAAIMGKEAALFVPTGTMGNTIAIKLHTNHGEEVLCEAHSHVMDWELSMMAWFSGCLARTVASEDGILRWPNVEHALQTGGPHHAATTLIAIENTHNMAGGTVYPLEAIDEICEGAHERGLKVHMDGARVFNASAASRIAVDRIVRDVDSVMFCLSKGLGAPIGSVLAGTRKDIDRARLYRKRLGGGMRQAGVVAAAGLIALADVPDRLVEDHANAKFLAERLSVSPRLTVDPGRVQTNIVIFGIEKLGCNSVEFSEELKQRGVLANGVNSTQMRLVTHRDVTRADCEQAIEGIEQAIRRFRPQTISTGQ
jgi:threonine aldolase